MWQYVCLGLSSSIVSHFKADNGLTSVCIGLAAGWVAGWLLLLWLSERTLKLHLRSHYEPTNRLTSHSLINHSADISPIPGSALGGCLGIKIRQAGKLPPKAL